MYLNAVSGVDIALWSGLEINVAIICGSAPALKAFVSKAILHKTDGKTSGYGDSSVARKQSRVLESIAGDDEYKTDRLKINVRESIEMNRYHNNDDGGSENDPLIQNNGISLPVPMKVKISSGLGDTRSSPTL
jgi:hypothetical protein